MHAQSRPTLCDHTDCRPQGSSVHRILQARILEWAAISSSRGSFQPRDWTSVSCVSCICRRILYHRATWEALNLQGVHLNVNLVSNLSTVSLTALGITDWTNYLWRNKYSFLAVDIPVHTPLYSCLIIDFRCIPKGRISKRLCVFCQLWVINLGNHSLYGEQALTGTPSSVLRGLHINCCW